MKIVDLNVNGLRAFLSKGGEDFVKFHNPDIICFQETRINEIPYLGLDYPFTFHNQANRKGYAGTMVYSKLQPLKDLTQQYDWDNEGRLQVINFENFILINVYVPSSLRNSERFGYRMDFNTRFRQLIQQLKKDKPIIICGDFNTVRSNLDMDISAHDYEAKEFQLNEREILLDLEV